MVSAFVPRTALTLNLRQGKKSSLEKKVATDKVFSIHVNTQHLVTLIASPDMTRELAIGHLMAEGIIESIKEIKEIWVSASKADIRLTKNVNAILAASKTMALITTACGSTGMDFPRLLDRMRKPFVSSTMRVNPRKIYEMARRLNEESRIYKATHGTHSAAIFTPDGKLVSFAEDVGRHNAIDKVIGDAALKQIDFSNSILASSGRQPAYMVLKAAGVGIPILISIAYPLESGIALAEKTGVTLILARGSRISIFAHPERICVESFSLSS